jgi:hypothetical protein
LHPLRSLLCALLHGRVAIHRSIHQSISQPTNQREKEKEKKVANPLLLALSQKVIQQLREEYPPSSVDGDEGPLR